MRRCLRTWMTSSLRSAGVVSWHVGVRRRSLPLWTSKQGSAQLELLPFRTRRCPSHPLKHFLGIRGVVEGLGGARTEVDGRSIVRSSENCGFTVGPETGSPRSPGVEGKVEAAPVGGHVTGSVPRENRFADNQISATVYVILGDRSSYLYRVVKNLETAHGRDD